MLIGVDFDNTIACYDEGFVAVAREMRLVPADFGGPKKAVRDLVRAGPGGDVAWQRLQARIYGRDISRARLADGMKVLLERARLRSIPVVVVSHKTQFSPFDPETDLRAAATGWMEENGVFDAQGMAVRRENVFFETTRQDKIHRIVSLGCTHFIDDLDEVFREPEFPGDIRSYLYAAGYEELPEGPFRAFRTHREIADHILGTDPVAAAAALMQAPATNVMAVTNGGNNRLYRVAYADGAMALKSYPSPDDDPRDRLGTEYGALSFLKAQGEPVVPAPIAMSRVMQAALYQWIDGEPVRHPGVSDIDEALGFVRRLQAYGSSRSAGTLGLASEAVLSTAELLRQIARREERLSGVKAGEAGLRDFLARLRDGRDRIAAALMGEPGRELPPAFRMLSPSDFGFHNALRRSDGCVVFVDFEYFGWDDPVKLAADFMLHPGMDLDQDCRRRFARGMAELNARDPDFRARLKRHLPLYVLRWCLILLNEFLPERWARRTVAGSRDIQAAKVRQLTKAEAMLTRVATAIEDVE